MTKTRFVMLAAACLFVIAAARASAGGSCAPLLREIEAKLKSLPDAARKQDIRMQYEAAKKAANNYDDEGCLEHAKAALAQMAAAKRS